MATQRPSILGANTVPDSSGDVFQEPYSIKATNDLWEYLVTIFNDSGTRIGLRGQFPVPQGYVDTANLVIVWTSTATSGDVEWDFDYRAVGGNDTESLDQSSAQETVNSNDTAPSAVNERMEISIALTDGNFAAGDTVQFELFRDGTDAGDTMAAAAILHDVYFEYADA
jgi:hypothetical protein